MSALNHDHRLLSIMAELIEIAADPLADRIVAKVTAALAGHDARLAREDKTSWLSAGEVARRLEVSADTARSLLSEQGIRPVSFGSVKRYPAGQVQAWLDRVAAEQAPKRRRTQRATPVVRPGVVVIGEPRRNEKAG